MTDWRTANVVKIKELLSDAPANTFCLVLLGPVASGKTVIAASLYYDAIKTLKSNPLPGFITTYLDSQVQKIFRDESQTTPTRPNEHEAAGFRYEYERDSISLTVIASRGEDLLEYVEESGGSPTQGQAKSERTRAVRFKNEVIEQLLGGEGFRELSVKNEPLCHVSNIIVGFVLNPLRDIGEGVVGKHILKHYVHRRIKEIISSTKKTVTDEKDRIVLLCDRILKRDLPKILIKLLNVYFAEDVLPTKVWKKFERELRDCHDVDQFKQKIDGACDLIVNLAAKQYEEFSGQVVTQFNTYPDRTLVFLSHFDVITSTGDHRKRIKELAARRFVDSGADSDKVVARLIPGPFAYFTLQPDCEWVSDFEKNGSEAAEISASVSRAMQSLESLLGGDGRGKIKSGESRYFVFGPLRFFGSLGDLAMSLIYTSPMLWMFWLGSLLLIAIIGQGSAWKFSIAYWEHGSSVFAFLFFVWAFLVLPLLPMHPYRNPDWSKFLTSENIVRWRLRRVNSATIENGKYIPARDILALPNDATGGEYSYKQGVLSRFLNCAWVVVETGGTRFYKFLPEFSRYSAYFGNGTMRRIEVRFDPRVTLEENLFFTFSAFVVISGLLPWLGVWMR